MDSIPNEILGSIFKFAPHKRYRLVCKKWNQVLRTISTLFYQNPAHYHPALFSVDTLDWEHISVHQKLSENFIREFQDKVNWIYVCIYQKLSEKFIEEFQDKVDWECISMYQKLSEDFTLKFSDKIDLYYISEY